MINTSVSKVKEFTKVQAIVKEGSSNDFIIPDMEMERSAKESKVKKVTFKCSDCNKTKCIFEKHFKRINDSKLKQSCAIMSSGMCGDSSDSEDGDTCQMKRGKKKDEWYAQFGGVKEENVKENSAEMELYDERVLTRSKRAYA